MDLKLAKYAYNPEEVNNLELDRIKELAENNPNAITIWMIYCKKLLKLNHPDFSNVLRRTAFFAPDRQQLHRYLYDASWKVNNDILPTQDNKPLAKDSNELDTEILAHAVNNTILQEVSALDISEIEKLPVLEPREQEGQVGQRGQGGQEEKDEQKQDEDLRAYNVINANLSVEENEVENSSEVDSKQKLDNSFLSWISNDTTKLEVVKAPSFDKTEEDSEETEEIVNEPQPTETNKLSREELIQRFVDLDPKITPKKVEMYNPVNMAKQSNQEDYSLVTETLANIYLNQGQYQKAKKAFEALSLRIPEKKSYFADQLKKIEELIQQKKHK